MRRQRNCGYRGRSIESRDYATAVILITKSRKSIWGRNDADEERKGRKGSDKEGEESETKFEFFVRGQLEFVRDIASG